MNRFTRLLLACLLVIPFVAKADDVRTVEGEATYHGTINDTPAQCRQKALLMAKNNALGKAFGWTVSSSTYQQSTVSNDRENEYFDQSNVTEVQGEWVSDIGEPEYKVYTDDEGCQHVTCRVKGKARRLTNEAIDFEALLLRNGVTRGHESAEFKSGDDMYVILRSPVNGYAMIFLEDDAQNVVVLLPYIQSDGNSVFVERNKDVVFFSKKHNSDRKSQADEFQMTTDRDIERDNLIVVFSDNFFGMPKEVQYLGDDMPRMMKREDFNRWRERTMRRDKRLSVKMIPFVINGN